MPGMVERMAKMKKKAEWSLSQQLIEPINRIFGSKQSREKTPSELADKRTGIIDLTPEELEIRRLERENMSSEEKARRDPNHVDDEALRMAMFCFSMGILILSIAVAFSCYCKHKRDE